VMGHFFFQMLGLPVTSSKIDKRDAHSFCNSYSPSISASNAEKRIVDYAVARSISVVYRLCSNNPFSFATVCANRELGR
jgi:hypothetical protein